MRKGDFIRIDYTGKIKETGEVFDTTKERVAKDSEMFKEGEKYGPVPVIVGEKKAIEGVDDALKEMEVGEKEKLEVPPEKAFGKRKSKLIKLVPLSHFRDQNINPAPGMPITMDQLRGRILSVNSGRVRVDFNHPLAGKKLSYEIEIKEKIEGEEEKIKAICEYYTKECSKIKTNKKEVELEMKEKEVKKETKEKITNDIIKHLKFKKVKFSEVFEGEKEDKEENKEKR